MPASIVSSSTIRLLILLSSVLVQCATAESLIEKSTGTGYFDILNVTLQQYDVPELLQSLGGFKVTIFGPTDAAFTAAGMSNGAEIPEPVLLRHAVLGEYTAEIITSQECREITSLGQNTLVMKTASDGSVTINGVPVNTTLLDITGDEGIFHGLNGVIPQDYPGCSSSDAPVSAPSPTAAPQAAGKPDSAAIHTTAPSLLLLAVASSIVMSCVF